MNLLSVATATWLFTHEFEAPPGVRGVVSRDCSEHLHGAALVSGAGIDGNIPGLTNPGHHPFTLPSVRPEMSHLDEYRNRIITGTATRIDPAANLPAARVYCPA